MVNVDIDIDLYNSIKEAVKKDKLNYPSIRNFIQKILLEKIEDKISYNNQEFKNVLIKNQKEVRKAMKSFDKHSRILDEKFEEILRSL